MSNLSERRNEHLNEDEQVTTGDIAGKSERGRPRVVPVPGGNTTPVTIPSSMNTELLSKEELEQMRLRWTNIQTNFVDSPRKSLEDADKLVASAIKRVAEVFYEQREELERQWHRGEEPSTEDLRLTLQRYRDFFSRVLSM